MEPTVARGRANARVALVGNPSDLVRGAVVACTIEGFEATVEVESAQAQAIEGPAKLIAAALSAYPSEAPEPLRVALRTTIPRQVGMGGSSAIVIATMRAIGALVGEELAPGVLAEAAHKAELDGLGIVAGPQDRYAQAYGGLVLMDFAGEEARVERLDPGRLPPLFLAFREGGGESSGVIHATAPVAHPEMRKLAGLAREAGRLLAAGDGAAIAALMDASFDARARMMELDPRHVEMVETARAHGAAANYTGSGGAIVGTVPRAWPNLRAALERAGCTTTELHPT